MHGENKSITEGIILVLIETREGIVQKFSKARWNIRHLEEGLQINKGEDSSEGIRCYWGMNTASVIPWWC